MASSSKKQTGKATATVAPVDKDSPAGSLVDSMIITPLAPSAHSSAPSVAQQDAIPEDAPKKQPATPMAIILASIAAIGGFMFGYESGQISGMFSCQIHLPPTYNSFQVSSKCPTSSLDSEKVENSALLVQEQLLVCSALEHWLDVSSVAGCATRLDDDI
jgi:hypothetical protein